MSDGVVVQLSSGEVEVNFGANGAISGASTLTTLNRLTKVTSTGTVGMTSIAEPTAGNLTGVVSLRASGSAGLLLENSNGDDVLLLGAGPSQGITAYGQINGTSVALSAGLTCTTIGMAGALTGVTTITASGAISTTSATASTSTTTGALVVSGGAGFGGNVNIGGDISVSSGDIVMSATNNLISTGSSDGADNRRIILAAGGTADPSRGAVFQCYGNEYPSLGGRIYFDTGEAGSMFFRYGASSTTALNITSTGVVSCPLSTASSSTTTGALVVAGGAGFGGAVYIGGIFNSTVTADTSHLCQVINSSSGTSALSGVEVQNNNGSNTRLRFQAYGSGLTATAFGLTLGGYTSLVTLGSSANGLIIGCQSIDAPIIFGINAGIVGRFETSATADDTTLLLLDVTAGSVKRVSRGAADSGGTGYRVLRIAN